jgi:hypothetical protein
MNRLIACFVHLCISGCVGLVLLGLFWFVWYPFPLGEAVGGLQIFLLLLLVDIAMGPLLTLVVFNKNKKSLRIDLTVIGALQFLALTYGLMTLLEGRPVYIAALGHRFDLIQASDVDAKALEDAGHNLPWFGPKWVGTRAPDNQKQREALMFGGGDLGSLPKFHVSVGEMRQELLARAEPIRRLKEINPEKATEIDSWLGQHAHNSSTAVYQGLKARNADMTVMIEVETAKIIGVAPFKPWP